MFADTFKNEITKIIQEAIRNELDTIKTNPEPRQDIIYTNKTLAEKLDVSERTLKKYRDEGKLAFSQVHDKFWYKEKDVDDFLRKYRFGTF